MRPVLDCEDCGKSIGHRYVVCLNCSQRRQAYRDALGFSVAASFDDIGRELGITRSGAYYIYEQALRKLKARGGRQLRQLLAAMMEER